MFSLSTKGFYGLEAVLDLAVRYNEGPVQIKEIAERNAIPQHYLEQLLVTLRRNGVTSSFRGTQGGYRLADSPDRIEVKTVLEALEGPLEIVAEERRGGPLQFFFDEIYSGIDSVLSLSLAQLIEKKNKQSMMYFI